MMKPAGAENEEQPPLLKILLTLILLPFSFSSISIILNYPSSVYIYDWVDIYAYVYNNSNLVYYPECKLCYEGECYNMYSEYNYSYYSIYLNELKTYYFTIECYNVSKSFSIEVKKAPSRIDIVYQPKEVYVKDTYFLKVNYVDKRDNAIITEAKCTANVYRDGKLILTKDLSFCYPHSYCLDFVVEKYGKYDIKIKCERNDYEPAYLEISFVPKKLKAYAYVNYPSYLYTYEKNEIKVYYPKEGKCYIEIDGEKKEMKFYNTAWIYEIGPFYEAGTKKFKIYCTSDVYEDYKKEVEIEIKEREMDIDLYPNVFYYNDLPIEIELKIYDAINFKEIFPDCRIETNLKNYDFYKEKNRYYLKIGKNDAGNYYVKIKCSKKGYKDKEKIFYIKIKEAPTYITLEILPKKEKYYTYEKIKIRIEYYDNFGNSLEGNCYLKIGNREFNIKSFEYVEYEIEPEKVINIYAECKKKNYEKAFKTEYLTVIFPKIIVKNIYLPKEIKINKEIVLNPIIEDELGRRVKNVICKIKYFIKDFTGKIVERKEIELKEKTILKFENPGDLTLKIVCEGRGYEKFEKTLNSKVVVISREFLPLLAILALSSFILLIVVLKVIKKI